VAVISIPLDLESRYVQLGTSEESANIHDVLLNPIARGLPPSVSLEARPGAESTEPLVRRGIADPRLSQPRRLKACWIYSCLRTNPSPLSTNRSTLPLQRRRDVVRITGVVGVQVSIAAVSWPKSLLARQPGTMYRSLSGTLLEGDA